jgi:hypothetical protein
MYRPIRAVSICISSVIQVDASTGERYVSVGRAATLDPLDGQPKVHVSIRAAGLAAESLIYNEPYEDLMQNPEVRFRIKTDMDNAKIDLERGGLSTASDAQLLLLWRMGFDDAVVMMRGFRRELECIADYCLANLDREIPRAELVEACNL